MSRSGYDDGYDFSQWPMIMWRGQVASAIRGKRGQSLLLEMLAALDALPQPMLVSSELDADGRVCALGAVGKYRGIDMSKIDPEDTETVAGTFNIAEQMAREIVWLNDEWDRHESDLARWVRMRRWVVSQIQ